MTDSALHRDGVPPTIEQKLRRLIRRLRVVILLRGLLAVTAVAVGALLVVMAIDAWVTLFSPRIRWALTLSAGTATVMAALFLLVRPLARSFTLTGVARAVELRHPELQERVSSAVELLTSRDDEPLRGSETLISALSARAADDVRSLQPQREVTLRSLRPVAIAAASLAAVLLVLLTAWPGQARRLLARAVAPHANLPNIAAGDLRISPGRDVVVPAGESFGVEVEVDSVPVRRSSLRMVRDGQTETPMAMTAMPTDEEGTRRFVLTIPDVQEGFRYRVHAGDALSRYFRVDVTERPAVESIDLTFRYPAYTAREDEIRTDASGDISAVTGTTVTVDATFNKPISSAVLAVGDTSRTLLEDADTSSVSFEMELKSGLDDRWSLELTDEHGLVSRPLSRRVEAVADAAPRIRLNDPAESEIEVSRRSDLPVTFDAADDFGIAAVELHIRADGKQMEPRTIYQPESPAPRHSDRTALKLSDPEFKEVRELTFHLVALDTLPAELGGPQKGRSRPVTVRLEDDADTYDEQALLAEMLNISESLEQALEQLRQAREHSKPLRDETSEATELTEPMGEKIEEARQHLGDASEELGDLAEDLADGVFDVLAETVADVDQSHVTRASELLLEIQLSDEPQLWADLAEEGDDHTALAEQKVEDLLEQFTAMAELMQQLQALQDLAQWEEELAEADVDWDEASAAEEADGDMMLSPEQWTQDQSEVASQIAEMMSEMESALAELAQRDEQRSRTLAERARELAARQRKLAEKTEFAGKLREDHGAQDEEHQQDEPERSRRELRSAFVNIERRRIQSEHEDLAGEAAELADVLESEFPQTDRLQTRAARAITDAVESIESENRSEAAERSAAAAEKLSELAERLSGDAAPAEEDTSTAEPPDEQADVAGEPDEDEDTDSSDQLPPELAEMFREMARQQQREALAEQLHLLARRQRRAADELAALGEDDPEALLETRQQALAEDTGELHADVALLDRHATDLLPEEDMRQLAAEAKEHVYRALQEQDSSLDRLTRRRADRAVGHQKQASDELDAAADALEQLGDELAELREEMAEAAADQQEPWFDSDLMAEAYEAAAAAAEQASQSDAAQAAEYLQALVGQAMDQAMAMGLQPQQMPSMAMLVPMPGGDEEGQQSLFGAGEMPVILTDQMLSDLGMSADDWARLPGDLQRRVLHAHETTAPEEYRELISRYFRELARRTGRSERTPEQEDE